MSKAYYADYVNHMLRFYFRYDSRGGFKNETDKNNYISVDRVIKRQSDADRIILERIYRNKNPKLREVILSVGAELNLNVNGIWNLINAITNKIAKERGLL